MKKVKEVRTQLTAAEYWEWRTAANEKMLEEKKLALIEKDAQIHGLTTHIQALKFQEQIRFAKDKVANMTQELELTRKKIEQETGTSLAGKMITESFQIEDLPAETVEGASKPKN